jgi:hypothetical protein
MLTGVRRDIRSGNLQSSQATWSPWCRRSRRHGGTRRLARQLFADLPDDVFNGFDVGLLHVITRFRGVLAEKDPAITNGRPGPPDGPVVHGAERAHRPDSRHEHRHAQH